MKPIRLIALLALGCSHDAKRENPLDLELTPAMEFSIAVNDSVGSLVLSWTPYAGTVALREYLVLRRVVGAGQVDTLARLADPAATSHTD